LKCKLGRYGITFRKGNHFVNFLQAAASDCKQSQEKGWLSLFDRANNVYIFRKNASG
jgi:hypothetical protein